MTRFFSPSGFDGRNDFRVWRAISRQTRTAIWAFEIQWVCSYSITALERCSAYHHALS